ncbi:phage terminase small subunit P27 family [Prevotella sp.]|uniref:phage terminase small subunit P27 family n=1 Tax=Prevotella sp. TaxID=59823 RepID=UPI002F91EA1C
MKYKYNLPIKLQKEVNSYINKVVDFLNKEEKIKEVDEIGLNLLATNYQIYLMALKDITENGISSIGSRGNNIPNPSIKIMNDAQIQITKLFEKFGLTPKDREKLNILTDSDEDESALFKFLKK